MRKRGVFVFFGCLVAFLFVGKVPAVSIFLFQQEERATFFCVVLLGRSWDLERVFTYLVSFPSFFFFFFFFLNFLVLVIFSRENQQV